MKHIYVLLTACLGLLAACSSLNEKDFEENTVLDDGGLVERVIFEAPVIRSLGDDDETRASLSQEGNGGIHFGWEAKDIVGIYPNQGGQVYFSMADGVGTNVARFDGGGWALRKGYTYSCYYPLVSDMFLDRNAIPVSFANQVQTGVSTYEGVRFFLASEGTSSSDGTLHFTFKILNTVIRIKAIVLPAGTYTKLTLTTEDDLFIQDGTFGLEHMEITGKTYSNTLELLLNDFVLTEASTEANPVLFYLTSAPIDLTGKTIIIRAYSEDGSIYECEKTPGKAYEAGDWGGLKCVMKQPNNVIYYTSTSGYPVRPYKTNAFGAEIVSNKYSNGKGIITFSSDVKLIGADAFNQCSDLKSISIPNSVTMIGDNAFGTCIQLETLNIPEGVLSIGSAAFCNCNLTSITIPNSVSSIGSSAFNNCDSIISLTIPESVSSVGMYAFADCDGLKRIYFLNPAPITVSYSIFDEVSGFTIFVPPSSVSSYKNTLGWDYYSNSIYAIPEFVDLGLTVKWATFNIGASTPEEPGDYFSWGETDPYYSYLDPLVWKYGKSAGYAWTTYSFNPSGDGISFSKYNGNDSDTLLDEDDTAIANWGEPWRMPTYEEWMTLIDPDSFDWTWDDTIKGYTVTSKIPGYVGNSIFLPAAGAIEGRSLLGCDDFGNYWSSSLWPYSSPEYIVPGNAWSLNFYSSNVSWTSYNRFRGHSVRPVTE